MVQWGGKRTVRWIMDGATGIVCLWQPCLLFGVNAVVLCACCAVRKICDAPNCIVHTYYVPGCALREIT